MAVSPVHSSPGRPPASFSTFPEQLFRSDRFSSNSRVHAYSRLQYLTDIVHILSGSDEFDIIMQSPFCGLFMLPLHMSSMCGKLVHNFLCRQLICDLPDEMWFAYGGHPFLFSIREFETLTGLPCGPFPTTSLVIQSPTCPLPSNSYWNELFGSDTSVKIPDIVNMLKTDPTMPGWKRLRLVLIVIVDVLLPGAYLVRPTCDVVAMVKNVDNFMTYPWGRASFFR